MKGFKEMFDLFGDQDGWWKENMLDAANNNTLSPVLLLQ